MFDTRRPLSRGSRRLSTVTLIGTALLAACNTDSPVAPNAAVPSDASLAKISGNTGSPTLVIRMIDQHGNPIAALAASAKFTIEEKGQAPIDVIDNGKRDADLAVGIVRVNGLAAGTWIVCQTVAPTDRVLPATPCATIALVAGRIGSLDFVNLAMARVRIRVVDYVNNLIGGMEFSWRDPVGNYQPFTDNQAPDLDSTPGEIEIKVAVEGTYQICEAGMPAGYVPPPQQQVFCFGVALTHGEITTGPTFTVYPEFSAYWGVTGGAADSTGASIGIGGSAFTVTQSLGTITVVDNGANDFDPRVGRLAVKLTGEGYYTICQTVVPANYSAPSPACKRIQVFGEPVNAGWFFDSPI